jgi:transposase
MSKPKQSATPQQPGRVSAPKKAKPKRATRTSKPGGDPGINLSTHADAAGIDIGAEECTAALPPGRAAVTVRTFDMFTSGIEALRDWLLEHGIRTAALESTGNYWITLYDTLSLAGIDVYLVNARHVKGVPGKKTDVQDAQWLQQLHAAGLLRKSFRPSVFIVPLRYLMRHRAELVGDASKQLQTMIKVLVEMNLKLHHVFSDIDGQSAQAIIDAILLGERDADKLMRLRDRRCKSPEAVIREALRGNYSDAHLLVLKQSQSAWRHLQAAIAEIDAEVAKQAQAAIPDAEIEALRSPAKPSQHRLNKNTPQTNPFELGWQYYRVDLSSIDGVSGGVISTLMSEVGTRDDLLRNFRSADAFCSWLKLCPDNRISGGKVLKAKTRSGKNRLAQALQLAAFGLNRSQSALGQMLHRLKGKLGKAEAITAVAHKLARIIYGMLRSGKPYDEREAFRQSPQNIQRQIRRIEQQATKLGLKLIAPENPAPKAA